MNSLSKNAIFITTDYTPYFSSAASVWSVRRPPLYQHTDLFPQDGLPMFAADFTIKKIDNAKIIFSALGCVDIYINGKRIGNEEMKPGWSDYTKRALYTSTKISEYLVKGKNRVLAVVAPGWYAGRISGGYYGDNPPSFIATIVNGGKEVISTDTSWKAKVGGPILTADIWDGEYRDGRKTGYDKMSMPDFGISGWKKADKFAYTGEVTQFIGPEIRVRKSLCRKPEYMYIADGVEYNGSYYGKVHKGEENPAYPVKVKTGQKLIIDLGQEIVGRLRLNVSGKRGSVLKVRYAEFLNDSGKKTRGNDGPEGSLYTINFRSALAKSYYVFAGKEPVDYAPVFTFFGFRFIELSADDDFTVYDILGEVMGNDIKEIGSIETSDESINKLISNIIWGQRSNYFSVPTDCPQRDERLGWTGDAQAFSVTASYNADVYGFFRKWMQDMRDSQGETGGYADVNPRVGYCQADDACAWGDAGIIIPYNIYIAYGDKRILTEHYDSMEKYIAGLVSKYGYSGPIPRYGDWLAYDWCENEYCSSAYFVHDLDLMIYMSNVLGKADRAEHYAALREKALKYFRSHFMKRGKLVEKTQCNKILALAFNLLDEDYAKQVADELEKQIKDNGDRLSCGFLGTYNLCPALSKYGKDKTAYNLLLQRKEPSWLYSVDQGATTIWERWNSYTKSKGFGDVGMNSFNHYAYGAIGEWMYRFMAGIEPAEPGFKSIKLQPRIDTRTAEELPEGQKNITFVKASYKSASGMIKSEWSTEDGFVYKCSVPKNTIATLELPVTTGRIKANGKTLAKSRYTVKDGKAIIRLAPGEYVFEQK